MPGGNKKVTHTLFKYVRTFSGHQTFTSEVKRQEPFLLNLFQEFGYVRQISKEATKKFKMSPKAHSEPSQTSKIEDFTKVVNS